MEIEIIDEPIRFALYGLSSNVKNRCYGEVGLRLMNEMWGIVNEAKLATTGINHWVYLALAILDIFHRLAPTKGASG